MLMLLTSSRIDILDAGAVPAASTMDTSGRGLKMPDQYSEIWCIFDGGEIGSTGVVKTGSRQKQKKLNGMLKASNDNVPYSAMKVAA
jgi:hypothetical protein